VSLDVTIAVFPSAAAAATDGADDQPADTIWP